MLGCTYGTTSIRGIDGKISLPCNYVSDVHNLFKFPSLHVTRASLLYPPAPHVLFRTVLPPPPSFFGRYTIFYHMHINDDIRSKLSLIICRNSTYLANRRQTEIPSRSNSRINFDEIFYSWNFTKNNVITKKCKL